MGQKVYLLQLAFDNDQLPQIILGFLFSLLLIVLVVGLILRDRIRSAKALDMMLIDTMMVSLADLRVTLKKPRLDSSTLRTIVDRSKNGVLSFNSNVVVSIPLLRDRLKRLLHENSVINTADEADMWRLPDTTISQFIEEIAKDESIDIIRTRIGDYLIVTPLKSKYHDDLEFQGMINIKNEAQRLGVEISALSELIYSWGWDLIPISDDIVASGDWIRVTLNRMVMKEGYLDAEKAARRLGISVAELNLLLRRLDWETYVTDDERIIPLHIVEEMFREWLEREGIIDLTSQPVLTGIPHDILLKVARKIDRQIIETTHGELATIDYIRRQIEASTTISGWTRPEIEAETLGVDSRLIARLLHSDELYRHVSDGRYVSLRAFREWVVSVIKNEGIIQVDVVKGEWGMSTVDLQVLLKRFEIKTTTTDSGDFLSLQWARQKIQSMLAEGRSIAPNDLVSLFGIDEGIATALLANIETAAYQTRDGRLVPEEILRKELHKRFLEKGSIDPTKEARRLGLDATEIERIIDSLALDAIKSSSGTRISILGLLKYITKRLDKEGVVDLLRISKSAGIDYEQIVEIVERRLTDDEIIVDSAQCIVRQNWVKSALEPATTTGRIMITEFAKKHNIRRSAALSILRYFLRGAYIASKDMFIVVSEG